jgi:NAD(P)-dependent dehydrogenase (short-subunit alcohol dehydrogenase family)
MNNPFLLEGKNVVITGASSGIGRECAIQCSKMGAKVVLVARNKERLKETVSLCSGEGHLIYSLDITEFEKIDALIKDAVEKIGKISGFIHSAGIEVTMPFRMIKASKYYDIFNINVFSAFEFIKVISKKQNVNPNGASVMIIASILSLIGQKGQVAYAASKSALVGACKAMAIELGEKNVRVNLISPGQVDNTMMTDKVLESLPEKAIIEKKKMHILGWVPKEEVAYAAVYLLSDATSKITGSNLIIDSGYSAQ